MTKDGSKPFEVDKVRIAREMTESGVDLTVLDLQDRIVDVVTLIKDANT